MIVKLLHKTSRWLRNLLRDMRFLLGMVPALIRIKMIAKKAGAHGKGGGWSAVTWWDEVASKYSDRTFLVYVDGDNKTVRYTYREVDWISNRCARVAMDAGIEPGTTVALSSENSPEYIFWLLGLIKVGAPVALINTNIAGAGLARCLESCRAELLIHSDEMRGQVEPLSSLEESDSKINLLCMSDLKVDQASSERIPPGIRNNVNYSDAALHIFTSGTTGLPKAAKISHLRYHGSSLIFSHLIGFKHRHNKDDVLYCPLPLYHSSAVVLGLGLCMHDGMPFVFQRKFSVSNFWKICVANDVTVVQYIGELCRYLVTADLTNEERWHKVRLALGNGLDLNVWEAFQHRFGIPKIVEFYAATEANVGLVNTSGKIGAVGVLSPLIAMKHPGKIIKFDFKTGQPHRDESTTGRLCVECGPNEVGEFVGMINPVDPTQKFDGYSDETETEKKLLRDVLRKGDAAFRSGDLVRRDEDGYAYFVDRIGDTIRWKGENVSTSEVEAAVQSSCDGVEECVVYGVHIEGYEGKAGMALVKLRSIANLPLEAIWAGICSLPEYARPVFLRFTKDELEKTVTFKYRKQEFASQGFGPNSGGTRDNGCESREGRHVYVRAKNSEEFMEVTEEVYKKIIDRTLKL